MGPGWTAVVGQRAEHRVRVALIAGAHQAARGPAIEAITRRSDAPGAVAAGVFRDDGVLERQNARIGSEGATTRVTSDGDVGQLHGLRALKLETPAPRAADGAVGQRRRRRGPGGGEAAAVAADDDPDCDQVPIGAVVPNSPRVVVKSA